MGLAGAIRWGQEGVTTTMNKDASPLLGITLPDPGHQNLVNRGRDILTIFFSDPAGSYNNNDSG